MAKTRKLTVEILGDAQGAMKAFGQLDKGSASLGQNFVAFGKKAAVAFTAVAAGAVAIGKSVVSAASDLQENLSKTQVVFGDAADSIIAFSKTTATAIGQSQNQALQAAGTFGVFGKAAGLTGSQLSSFSTDLVTLASDMASFSNTTPEEAIEALGAALRGESEPIRKYGVLLNDAALKAKAMELGIYDGNGTLTAQQKILAANAVIFEQTADAQGDFARTSDGLANQQRILAARFDDLKTRLGSALLPIGLKVANMFMTLIDKVGPLAERLLPQLIDMFKDLWERIKPVATAVGDVLAAAFEKIGNWMRDNTGTVKVFFAVLAGGATIAAVAALAASIASLFNPVGLIIAGIAALAAGVYYAYQRFETFRAVVDGVVSFVQSLWQTFGSTILDHTKRVFDSIKTTIEGVIKVIKGVIDTFIGVLTGDWGRAWDGIKSIVSGALDVVKGTVMMAVNPIITAFKLIGTSIGAVMSTIKSVVTSIIGAVVDTFQSGFSKAANIVKTIFSTISGTIKTLVQGAINMFISALNSLIGVINGAIRAYNAIPLAPDIPTIRTISRVQLAEGGIVTRPTNALIGEAGPEAVIPLSEPYLPDFLKSGSGDTYITVKVEAGLVSTPDQVGSMIIDAIKRAERRSGQVFAAA